MNICLKHDYSCSSLPQAHKATAFHLKNYIIIIILNVQYKSIYFPKNS